MRWIRTATDMINDKSVGRIARMCEIEKPHALGHIVCVLHQLPGQAIDGNLSDVDDEDLEDWAMWRGARGRFAAAFRSQMCDESATVKAWEKHNGAAIREYLRKHDRSTPGKKSPDPARPLSHSAKSGAEKIAESVSSRPETARLRDETRRDVTTPQQQLALVADAPTRTVVTPAKRQPKAADDMPPKFPHFPPTICAAGYQLWKVEAGDVNFGRFRNAFSGFFERPEPERLPKALRDSEFVPALQLYLDATIGTTEVSFGSVERCAERLSRIVTTLRSTQDRTGRTDAARHLLGFTKAKIS